MDGLFGITNASAPTSTDYTPMGGSLDLLNLAWTPSISNGGTKVMWSHGGPYGSGNPGTPMHVFGFTLTALGAQNGAVSIATKGFGIDSNPPITSRDISTTVSGPVGANASIPEPATFGLAGLGLGVAIFRRRILS